MEIVPEPEWQILFEDIKKHAGATMLMGATDSGKTTLARFLIKKFVSENIKVCLVDSDVGQSSIGIPGTISMKVFSGEKVFEDFTFEKMIFVGSTNPAMKIPSIIEGTQRMTSTCRENSDYVVIDTSGLVSGELGKALKINKIKKMQPELIVALQRGDELEHILSIIEDIPIRRIKASRMAKVRSREARMRYRTKKLLGYFDEKELNDFALSTTGEKFFYNRKPIHPAHMDFAKGTLIGLNQDGDTLALGVLTEITDKYVTFQSPIKSLRKINQVVFGDMKI